jgi:sugar transferase (PEP-CTERM system associated)
MRGGLLRGLTWRAILLIAFEAALIVGAVLLAARLRLGFEQWHEFVAEGLITKGLLIAFIAQAAFYYNELYDLRIVAEHRELVVRLLQALGITALILGVIYFWFPDLIIGRGVFLIAAPLIIGLVVLWRVVFEWMSRSLGPRERLLLVGTSPASVTLARDLLARAELGVRIVGFVDTDAARVGEPVVNPGVIGTIADIPAIVRDKNVDRVVVSLSDARGKLPMEKLLDMKLNDGVEFDHLADVYEEYTGKIAIENLRPSWLIFSAGFKKSSFQASLKRAFDLSAASLLFVLTLPVMGLTAILVRLTSPGPALYHQARVGQHGKTFTIHKFRSMRQDAEAGTGAVWAQKDDPRITLFGKIMRKTRLDELPQLWNVLRGEMSFVGPRPERPEFVQELTQQIPFYGQRHVVKPGVTGWAQVRYTYGSSVEDAMEKLQYDLFYIKHLSLPLDLYILFETVKTVLLRRGA